MTATKKTMWVTGCLVADTAILRKEVAGFPELEFRPHRTYPMVLPVGRADKSHRGKTMTLIAARDLVQRLKRCRSASLREYGQIVEARVVEATY